MEMAANKCLCKNYFKNHFKKHGKLENVTEPHMHTLANSQHFKGLKCRKMRLREEKRAVLFNRLPFIALCFV